MSWFKLYLASLSGGLLIWGVGSMVFLILLSSDAVSNNEQRRHRVRMHWLVGTYSLVVAVWILPVIVKTLEWAGIWKLLEKEGIWETVLGGLLWVFSAILGLWINHLVERRMNNGLEKQKEDL